MYLAPLNYDRYFKKAFSDLETAKSFLQDFLDVEIESIEALPNSHKVTDDAVPVEFDFRCKIGGRFVIVDMQQWYKPDVVQRFYAYHCINTAVQMQDLPLKSIAARSGKTRPARDYGDILPVITLVWMADDTLGFKEDRVAFSMAPELVSELVRDGALWENPDMAELLERREKALALLSNNTKRLGFLQENRLIYAFQKNIVANAAKEGAGKPRYLAWFGLAEKSKNKDNQKSDFAEYEAGGGFGTLLRRLNREQLTEEDLAYIEGYGELAEQVKRWGDGYYREGREEGIGIGLEKGVEIGMEKGIYETAKNAIAEGFPNDLIKKITKLTDDQIDAVRKEMGR